mgnify:CR=1 FL=1
MKTGKVELSHPDKVLFGKSGLTKKDLADYYERIADTMIRHIKGRPITLKRYPEGIDGEGFFNKHAPDYFPDYIERIEVPQRSKDDQPTKMIIINEAADLVYLAGQDVLSLHMGLSKKDDLEKPDQIIFDLDPSDEDFDKVRRTALALKDMLDDKGLPGFVKTSGSRGLHIHIPIKPEKDFSVIKDVARDLAEEFNESEPDLTTLEHRKNKRGDKVFLDILRNDYGMTAIAPYSTRARYRAPLAVPLSWSEISDSELSPQKYTIENIFRRLSQKDDPWADFYKHAVKV